MAAFAQPQTAAGAWTAAARTRAQPAPPASLCRGRASPYQGPSGAWLSHDLSGRNWDPSLARGGRHRRRRHNGPKMCRRGQGSHLRNRWLRLPELLKARPNRPTHTSGAAAPRVLWANA
jgi:hypothetical protein